jgi:hypothetical protein
MQCSRCSYIQFKSSSKCANCGYDFKKSKSNALAEAENTFTIFATAGAVAGNASQGTEESFPHESAITDREDAELYDSPYEGLTDQNESHVDNLGDFALDLSEAAGPDSESWDIGATLAEDLSETTDVASEDLKKDNDPEDGDFEVQGLGFDLDTGLDQPETEDSNDSETGEEESPEQEDFFLPEPEKDSSVESSEISLETELNLENNEPESEQTSETPVVLKDSEIELNPTLELEALQLDLETDSPEIEPIQADLPTDPEAATEEIKLKMDSDEDETDPSSSDKESTPDR